MSLYKNLIPSDCSHSIYLSVMCFDSDYLQMYKHAGAINLSAKSGKTAKIS